jgi:proteic killer suppression protein
VIKSFGSKATEQVFNRDYVKSLPNEIQVRALRKLVQIDEAQELDQLRIPPSNRLEALKGKLKGCDSIRTNQQWRIIFKWSGGDAREAEIVDYH